MSSEETPITPTGHIVDDRKQRLDWFISTPMRVANRCMGKLFPDHSFYHSTRYAHVGPDDAKKLFIYGAARQVLKASVALISYEDFLNEPLPAGALGTEATAIVESVIDEQNMWLRKLLELLVTVINFTASDPPEFYRIYLNAENLDLFAGKYKDFEDFYGFPSGNVKHSVNDFATRIEDDLRALHICDTHFLNAKKLRTRTPSVFQSIRHRFKRALLRASDDEKLIMGTTYHDFFSLSSVSVHPTIGSSVHEFDPYTVDSNIAFVSILGQRVMDRVNALAGFEDAESISKLMQNESVAPEIMSGFRKDFAVGDLVIAWGELCEIVDVCQSQFGYRGYKLKFLVRSPLESTPEDWVAAPHILRIVAKENIRTFMEKSFEETMKRKPDVITPDVAKTVLSQPDEVLLEAARNTFITLHRHGVLLPMIQGGRSKKAGPKPGKSTEEVESKDV